MLPISINLMFGWYFFAITAKGKKQRKESNNRIAATIDGSIEVNSPLIKPKENAQVSETNNNKVKKHRVLKFH